MDKPNVQEQQPFDVAWRTIDHCVWEERAPEFESIVAQWVSGGFRK